MNMKRINNLLLAGILLLLAISLVTPGPGQAQEKRGPDPGVQKEMLAKDLGLTPDKAKAFLAVGEKYQRGRQEIIERIRKNEDELEQATAAPQPDEAKIKGLVAATTADHNKLWETFKVQRQDEIALLTPVQQGKFLLALKKWHREMCVKYEKQGK
jgi:Spy/CpxP family protein refolding chaperone